MTNDVRKEDKCRHVGDGLNFPGVFVLPNFVTEEEEQTLVAAIDESPWKPSQSGRVKQVRNPGVSLSPSVQHRVQKT